MAVFSKNLSQDNCGWTLLVNLSVPPSSLTALCWTWTNRSPCQELAVREEDSLLKWKLDQRPARSDGGARSKSVKSDQCSAWSDGTRPKASKSDGGQILKKEGKNLSYLHKDTSSSWSRRASSVSRSGKSPSRNTRDDVQLLRPRPSPSPSPGSRDLGPASGAYNSSGSGSEMADGRSSLPMTARRASPWIRGSKESLRSSQNSRTSERSE